MSTRSDSLLIQVPTALPNPAAQMVAVADDGEDSSLYLGGVVEMDNVPEGDEAINEAPVSRSPLPMTNVEYVSCM